MQKNKKQRSSFLITFFHRDKLIAFGTVFFVTALVLLVGMFLFPTVRSVLHTSALATGMVPGRVSTPEAPPVVIFKDVDSTHPNAEAIAYLKDHHFLTGYPDGTFKPDDFVTRAELLKLLFSVQQVDPTPAVYRACFQDVADDWFAPFVCYAKAKGLVQGYADKTFAPGKSVTVAEALKIILLEFRLDLADASGFQEMKMDDGAWFAPYVRTALSKNLITWEEFVRPGVIPNLNHTTVATALLNRAQLAEILYRLVK